jgi:hypothetical protein
MTDERAARRTTGGLQARANHSDMMLTDGVNQGDSTGFAAGKRGQKSQQMYVSVTGPYTCSSRYTFAWAARRVNPKEKP